MKSATAIFMTVKMRVLFALTISIFTLIPACPSAAGQAENRETILRLHGSNTIGATLAPKLAEAFLKALGAASVNRVSITPDVEVDVEGSFPQYNLTRIIKIRAHGSSTGFTDLKNGECDIAMSSRRINKKEIKQLESYGDMIDVTCEHVLALDGVAVIINPFNASISSMDMTTLAGIFTGKITNWSQIGGQHAPIHLHTRDTLSGTFDTFRSIVLGNRSPAPSAKYWNSNETLSKAVYEDKNAIGFCALPYTHNNKVLKISDGGLSILPDTFTIRTEDYPITRRLHFYTPADPENDYTLNFVAFSLGKGQRFISEKHFVPLTLTASEYAVQIIDAVKEPKVINKYINAVHGAKRISTNYRFNSATDTLDSRAERDLDRMAEFLRQKNVKKIILAGFTDSNGDYWRNYQLSCDRTKTVKQKLRARDIAVSKTLCVGEEIPIASNDNIAGRAKNRRVEIWIK